MIVKIINKSSKNKNYLRIILLKDQERRDKIKKLIIIILLLVSSIKLVLANEYPEITSDVEIRYKWYKEIITGDYYPSKDISSDDKIDKNKIRYGNYSEWKSNYCNLSPEHYEITSRKRYKYNKVESVRYILLENFEYKDNIKIYYENKPLEYKIISQDNNQIKIELNHLYLAETLLFYITDVTNYKIALYRTILFDKEVISKQIQDEEILIPDKTWINENSSFVEEITGESYKNSDLTKKISSYDECRYREKYVYKYEIEREYYDENYYKDVEGYIKDINDYKFYYKGEPITNTIEIIKEKIVKEPQTEYIYIENKEINKSSKETTENDPSKDKEIINELECQPIIKKEVKIKEVFKIPKMVYILVSVLVVIITILIIKLSKKYVV